MFTVFMAPLGEGILTKTVLNFRRHRIAIREFHASVGTHHGDIVRFCGQIHQIDMHQTGRQGDQQSIVDVFANDQRIDESKAVGIIKRFGEILALDWVLMETLLYQAAVTSDWLSPSFLGDAVALPMN